MTFKSNDLKLYFDFGITFSEYSEVPFVSNFSNSVIKSLINQII
jgi:hypothetical protein